MLTNSLFILCISYIWYNNELQYTEKAFAKKRSRRINVIWFKPAWADEGSTNAAKKSLAMIDRHFLKGSNTFKERFSGLLHKLAH